MQILIADPPAYTPPYDHQLAAALARAGADVTLATSPFRFGAAPAPDGYRREELFYGVASRVVGGRSRLRLPLKAAEHPVGMLRLRSRAWNADVAHFQWLALPQVDRFLLPTRRPVVFTAHDLLPRRTARRTELWRGLFRRFTRVVVHTDHGRRVLGELGVEPGRLRVIAHPVFPSAAERADDGETLLFFGVIRPYRGLPDALEVARRLGTRLIVAGDPAMPLDGLRKQSGGGVEWRLGYLPEPEVERAHAEATVALFPYRPEIDQSGSLMRALGAGVPAVVYDVAGLAEPVRTFGAGRVVPAGDVDALAEATRELLADAEELRRAREGAERARRELTWDAAARSHLDLYRELT